MHKMMSSHRLLIGSVTVALLVCACLWLLVAARVDGAGAGARQADLWFDSDTGWLCSDYVLAPGDDGVTWNVTRSTDGATVMGTGAQAQYGSMGSAEMDVYAEPLGTVFTLTATFYDVESTPLETIVKSASR